MRLIDISRTLQTGAPHWPGDTPTEFVATAKMSEGSSCNVGRLSLSVHNGTHADAPYHYNPRGETVEMIALDRFVGPARVIDARGRAGLSPELLASFSPAEIAATPRLLFRTDRWTDADRFPTDWPLLEPTFPAWLAARGVGLIGLDVPSVDALQSRELPIHQALDAAGILIVENLDLRGVEPGCYELIALPLKLRGGDGSPLRAVLRVTG